MKGRWIPFLATTAALALAAVAPAQDRGRRGGGGGGGNERSSPPTRSEPPQRSAPPPRNDPPQRTSPPPTRSDPPQRTSPPPTRTDPPRERRSDPPSVPTRSDPGERSRRSDPPPNTGGSRGEERPTRTGGDTGRNPFDRSGGTGRNQPMRNDPSGRVDPGNRNDRPVRGGTNGERPVRERPSRSGNVAYGTRSNGYGNARPTRFGGGLNRTSLANQIRRTDIRTGYNVSYGGTFGGLRIGYVGYNNYWQDDFFAYPYYVFNPWASNGYCVASPWYRYSYLPGYINTSRVVVVNNYVSPWSYNDWSDYRYDYQDRNRDRRNEALDDTLDDIQDAFERNNTRYADRVVPQTGQVAIFNDGKYDYSLGAEDFQDMFLDGVEQSKTTRYEVIESKVRGDEVRLRARHEYEDSWGAKQVVFHSYTLRRENGRFVIREFGTD